MAIIPQQQVQSQRRLAEALLQQGSSTAPVQSPLEGLARALTAGVGGYFAGRANKSEEDQKAAYRETLARALQAGQTGIKGWQNPDEGRTDLPADSLTTSQPDVAPGMAAMAQILAGNPDTADMGISMQMQDIAAQQQAAQRQKEMEQQFAQQQKLLDQRLAAEQSRPVEVGKGATLINPSTGEVVYAPGGGGGPAPLFDTTSVEGQALNQLVANGVLSPDAALAWAAGKTVTGPGGQLDFITPQAVQQDATGQLTLRQPEANQSQQTAASFANRVAQSNDILTRFEDQGTSKMQAGLSSVPLIGNSLITEERQQFEQAQRDFINAILRRESGAVISDEEFENAAKQYFPQPGDAPVTVEQKRRARETALQNLMREAGPAALSIQAPQSAGPRVLMFDAQGNLMR